MVGLRINKYFTEHGICSRREADRFIGEGRVAINGVTAKLGDRVQDGDRVSLDGKPVNPGKKKPVILAYNKPAGVVCTTDQREPDNIVDAVGYPERIFNIGRLDQFSEGLILLTNMGEIVNKILRSKYKNEKEYIVDLNGLIDEIAVQKMANGLFILGSRTLPCFVEKIGPKRIRMILTEGRNRQIRRMVEEVGLRVSRLRRVRIMDIGLGDLAPNEWRKLSPKEMHQLQVMLSEAEKKAAATSPEESARLFAEIGSEEDSSMPEE